jgi:hypothetical protein
LRRQVGFAIVPPQSRGEFRVQTHPDQEIGKVFGPEAGLTPVCLNFRPVLLAGL